MAYVEELPCDDEQFDEPELFVRGLQSAGSGLFRSPPGSAAWSGSQSAPALWSPGSRDPSVCTASRPSSRPGTGRFSPEELACFRRVHTPSSRCDNKAEFYWATMGALKSSLSETAWHSLPVSKGKFYTRVPLQDQSSASLAASMPKKKVVAIVEKLPDEAMTAKVLNEIFPKSATERLTVNTDLANASSDPNSPTAHKRREEMESFQLFQNDVKKIVVMNRMSPKQLERSNGHRKSVDMLSQTPQKPLKPELTSTSPMKGTRSGNLNSPNPNSPSATSPSGGDTVSTIIGKTPLEMIIQFRKRLLEKCQDLEEVFEIFASEVPNSTGVLSKKEFRRSLTRMGLDLTKEERDAVFKQLDANGDGVVSFVEVQIVIEAAAPVRTLTDLRRRWLASGYTTMASALHAMEEGGIPVSRRLALREFGEALVLVSVFEHSEHLALFNIILDPSDPHSRVSIGELMCAIATVSPSLLLEDVRDRLHKRYNGNLVKAYADIDVDYSNGLEREEFIQQSMRRLGLGQIEAEKVFNMIDIDESGTITRSEFISALAMSEPSLFLEDLRQKIRQRFRSISEIFSKATSDLFLRSDEALPQFSLGKLQEMLAHLDLSDFEVKTLFEIIDTDRNGSLSLQEFLKGTRQLAPSCVFEDLRIQCLHRHPQICETFAEVNRRRSSPINFEVFSATLNDLKVTQDVNLKVIFDVLDIKSEGVVTLGRLIAALQAGGPGRKARLTQEERNTHAQQEIRDCTSTARRLAGDLKAQVRQGTQVQDGSPARYKSEDETEEGGSDGDTNASARLFSLDGRKFSLASPNVKKFLSAGNAVNTSGTVKTRRLQAMANKERRKSALHSGGSPDHAGDSDSISSPQNGRDAEASPDSSKDGASPTQGPPRIRTVDHRELKPYVLHQQAIAKPSAKKRYDDPRKPKPWELKVTDNEQSWGSVWKRLHHCDGTEEREAIEKKMHSYYQTATWRVSHDVPLLEQPPSRFLLHQNSRAHHNVLVSDKEKRIMQQ